MQERRAAKSFEAENPMRLVALCLHNAFHAIVGRTLLATLTSDIQVCNWSLTEACISSESRLNPKSIAIMSIPSLGLGHYNYPNPLDTIESSHRSVETIEGRKNIGSVPHASFSSGVNCGLTSESCYNLPYSPFSYPWHYNVQSGNLKSGRRRLLHRNRTQESLIANPDLTQSPPQKDKCQLIAKLINLIKK